MSDDLDSKLSALSGSAEFENGAMVLGQSGTRSVMAEVLRVIDNTILPRNLEFSVGDSFVKLAAGGRRLRRFVSASQDLNPPKDLPDQTLSNENEAPVKQVGALLQSLTSQAGKLTVLSMVETAASAPSDGGVGIGSLSGFWDVDLDAKPPTPPERFLALLGDDVIASAQVDGTSAKNAQGDATYIQAIDDALPEILDVSDNQHVLTGAKEAPRLVVLQRAIPEPSLVVLVHLDGSKAIAFARESAFSKVASEWKQFLA